MARLAAFDRDGTLLLPNHPIGKETLSTLIALHGRQITLAFATGRHLLAMQILRAQMSLYAWLITGNGTRIHDPEGNLLFASDLTPEVAKEVLYTCWRTDASI